MRVAVLGGGLQGCCVAMALADRGVRVVLYDRNPHLMARAAVANEGKIHLGYMYAADPSLRTAAAMIRGAMSFAPFFSRHLGVAPDRFALSEPAAYAVHRASQKAADAVAAHLDAVHALVQEHPESDRGYFGRDLRPPIRRWDRDELAAHLDPDEIVAAFDSPEVAIDPKFLAGLVRQRIAATGRIEQRMDHMVVSVSADERPEVLARHGGEDTRERFDHVVNALWDGRIEIDSQRGRRPQRPWIHRLKYGVDLRDAGPVQPIRSITIVSGPFGEIVRYPTGSIYLTWYPSCLKAVTSAAAPPNWPIEPGEPVRSEVLWDTFRALAAISPALRSVPEDRIASATVRGGPIVAWGSTDIYDPRSELHKRYEIGVTSEGRYHSIDPGKLTAAPYFAAECARRIVGSPDLPLYSFPARVGAGGTP